MLLFGWDGDTLTARILREVVGDAPPDVLARAVGSTPALSQIPGATGGLPVAFGTPGAATPGAVVDPRERPVRGCLYYDEPQNRLPLIIGPGAQVTLVTLPAVPVGHRGIVRYLALSTDTADGTWMQTRKNQGPVLPFTGTFGAVGAIADPTKIFIELAAGEVFDVVAVNTAPGNINVSARVIAWFWPEQ